MHRVRVLSLNGSRCFKLREEKKIRMIVIEQDSEEYVQITSNKLDIILDAVFNRPWKKSFGNVDHITAIETLWVLGG